MKALTDSQLEILRAACANSWYVSEENFLEVADLVRRGLVRVYDGGDEGMLSLAGTAKGERAALRLQLIRPSDPDDHYGKFAHGSWLSSSQRKAA